MNTGQKTVYQAHKKHKIHNIFGIFLDKGGADVLILHEILGCCAHTIDYEQ